MIRHILSMDYALNDCIDEGGHHHYFHEDDTMEKPRFEGSESLRKFSSPVGTLDIPVQHT